MKKIRIKETEFVYILIFILIIGVIIGSYFFSSETYKHESLKMKFSNLSGNTKTVEINLPAVDSKGNGVVAKLQTTVQPGTGDVFVSINNVLANYDTQYSGRIAAKAAADYLKIDPNTYDVFYKIITDADLIEGPSAGAAMTTSIILAYENKTMNPEIMMTGTIEEDGSIGQVGSIKEKAEAAKENGAKIFLVPKGQLSENKYKTICNEKKLGNFYLKTCNYVKTQVNISESIGIEVHEVSTIADIMQYFHTHL